MCNLLALGGKEMTTHRITYIHMYLVCEHLADQPKHVSLLKAEGRKFPKRSIQKQKILDKTILSVSHYIFIVFIKSCIIEKLFEATCALVLLHVRAFLCA